MGLYGNSITYPESTNEFCLKTQQKWFLLNLHVIPMLRYTQFVG